MVAVNVEFLKDRSDLLFSEWERLLSTTRALRAFNSPDWYLGLQQSLGFESLLITAREKSRLVGLLPLESRKGKTGSVGVFPHAILGESQDLLVLDHDLDLARNILEKIISKIDSNLFLINLRVDSLLLQSLSALLKKSLKSIEYQLSVRLPVPIINIESGWEAYMMSKSSGFRTKTRKLFRQFASLNYKYEKIENKSDGMIFDALSVFVENNCNRFGDESIFYPSEVRNLIYRVFPVFIEKNYINLLGLFDGKNALVGSFLECPYGQYNKNTLLAYQHGYLEGHDLPLGKYMLLKSIKNAADKGFKFYDLSRTENHQKQRVKTSVEKSLQLILPKPIES